jgi:hypothetical protein
VSFHDPNYVCPQFADASAGYLTAPAKALPVILARLPQPRTVRERAIYDVIEIGIRSPQEWDSRRRRMG